MQAFKYKLYKTKRTKHIDDMLREAAFTWNKALAMQKRYYSLYGKYINRCHLQKWFDKRYKRHYLGSQVRQEIIERLDTAYNRFFKKLAQRPPKFKKTAEFVSIVYKQAGYKLYGNELILNRKFRFKFSKSREYEGNIKRVIVKRSRVNEYYVVIVTDANPKTYRKTHNGASVGIDFGLKMYLTISDGREYSNPLFLKQHLSEIRKKSRNLSKCKNDSNNRKKKRIELAKLHEHLHNKREDYQFKLAHELCRKYDYIFIENLCLTGMTKMWGRKMNDLAHAAFINKLEYVASKYGVVVHKIDRWYASSKTCECGYVNKSLQLIDREWVCPECGSINHRDLNAAKNILRKGISELDSMSKTSSEASALYPRIPLALAVGVCQSQSDFKSLMINMVANGITERVEANDQQRRNI
jgi:putative transposase|nr:MAG TPA: endonuclease [Caudoviricetes sp.]